MLLLLSTTASSVDGPVVEETAASASGVEDGEVAGANVPSKERDDPALLTTWGYGTNDCEYLKT